MNHPGLDVSVKETSVCIVDETGKIVREVKVASEPEALLSVLKNLAYRFKRIGLEAGPLSQWLFSALAEAGLPVICVETRHMRAVLKAQINKTDRNDARGIAQMMRVGLYRPVHVKTLRSQKLRMLLEPAFYQTCPQSRPGQHWPADTLQVFCPEVLKLEQVADLLACTFGNHHRVRLSDALQAGCEVGRLAHDRLLLSSTRPNQITDNDEPGSDANPGLQRGTGS